MTALSLARTVAPVPPKVTCGEIYARMTQDDELFALAVVDGGVPIGLVGRVALMAQFARPYWREIYAHRSVTKLMDPAPVIVDVATPVEAIGLRFAAEKRTAVNAGFILVRDGKYYGVGSAMDLLQHTADRALQRALELSQAHDEIKSFTETLERRVVERTEELHAVQQEIVRKERLAAIGQLTATVAHEIRNPLSSIRNTLFTLKEALRDSALPLDRPLGRMERSVERCDGIINELLDYTRIRDLARRPIVIDQWLSEVVSELSIPSAVSLVLDLGAGGYRVPIDIERMRRVVVNLVENALHALAEVEGERAVTVATRMALGDVELSIADTGPGIPAAVLPKVFEPLFSTKSFGTGLGLPLVKQIVEQHGGSVSLGSAVPRGTRVVIRLRAEARNEIAA